MEYDKREQGIWERLVFADRGYTCLWMAGEGAFSRVYCLEDRSDGRIYACKVSSKVSLLEQEAQMMPKLRHPLFPECFEMWREAEKGFLLMEYVHGSTVEEMLRRRKCFRAEQVFRIGMELADGLRFLHEGQEAFVFRDVKPANIMIRQDGRVRLIDFGCACALGKEAVSRAGTPGFAAPEQMRSEGVLTVACDVYGWGQTMKALLGIAENKAFRKEIDSIYWKWAIGRPAERQEEKLTGRPEERQEEKLAGRPEESSAERTGGRPTGRPAERPAERQDISSKKAERAMIKNWINQGGIRSRKMRLQLWRVLDACTQQEPSDRIPDMRGVMAALMPFMSCIESRDNRENRKTFYFQKGIVCKKNIIMIQT